VECRSRKTRAKGRESASRERVWFAAPGPENWTREGGEQKGAKKANLEMLKQQNEAKTDWQCTLDESSEGGVNPQARVCCTTEELGNLYATIWN
jgi:hypothetical protein